jgi:hypothetical protein
MNFPTIPFNEILKSLNDPYFEVQLDNYFAEISRPRFQLREVGISSKVINDWSKAEIIDAMDAGEIRRWREFSLVEAIWLKFVEELRFFGVPLKTIRFYKKKLFNFDIEIFKEFRDYYNLIDSDNNQIQKIKLEFNALFENGDQHASDVLKKTGRTIFSSIILFSIIQRLNFAFYFNAEVEGFVDLSNTIQELFPKRKEDAFPQMIASKSFALINVKTLYTRFFDNPHLNPEAAFYFGIMKPKERRLLEQIRSGDYTKITITLEHDTIVLSRATKKNDEDLMKQIAKLLKKGDFKEVEFISRDGHIVKFNETEIIK